MLFNFNSRASIGRNSKEETRAVGVAAVPHSPLRSSWSATQRSDASPAALKTLTRSLSSQWSNSNSLKTMSSSRITDRTSRVEAAIESRTRRRRRRMVEGTKMGAGRISPETGGDPSRYTFSAFFVIIPRDFLDLVEQKL